ncbi:MAG: RNB domain-containing ribonuclease [Gammaproteobacteria bacterium]|nr:MAG: RNB domain-containing ribonuclease [Gammaproteobacteria bacterium]
MLYKSHPARVEGVGEKIEIALEGGKSRRVRSKDVRLLHPGPMTSLSALQASPEGNLEEAWELLQGERPAFDELAELVYGEFTPATAWATWGLLQDGLYFSGDPGRIEVRTAEQVEALRSEREQKAHEAEQWQAFLQRVEKGTLEDEDRKRLAEVERVALGVAAHSRILASFKVDETPEAAHRFLLRCGYWAPETNPWPQRSGVILESPELGVPALPEEERLDLTHLEAWAIDDEGNQDPDDAISLDGDYLWVHVADVAALVRPDGHLDLAARERSSNLYLPEFTVSMLPEVLTERLGLGLQEISPALSFGMRLGEGGLTDIRVERTLVRVRRTSYQAANARMQAAPFADIARITDAYRQSRLARHAARLDLPEASVRVVDGKVVIRSLPKLASRDMVTDAMLMAGEAAARFAMENDIPIPYAMQPEPEEIRQPKTLSEMYAYRRLFKPSNTVLHPEPHFGLGLECYARATSPLRRYADLLAHQQLRAFVSGNEPLPRERLAEHMAGIDVASARIRRAERQSNLHWKLVHLQRHPEWQGDAVVVALEERKAVLIIPELAMEIRMRLHDRFELDGTVRLKVRDVDLVTQDAWFQVV